MEIVVDSLTLILFIVALAIGGGIAYLTFIGKDKMAISIIRACESIMDLYGEDIKKKDPALYDELEETIAVMNDMAVDGTSFGEFVKFVRIYPGMFKSLLEVYEVDDWVRNALKKVK